MCDRVSFIFNTDTLECLSNLTLDSHGDARLLWQVKDQDKWTEVEWTSDCESKLIVRHESTIYKDNIKKFILDKFKTRDNLIEFLDNAVQEKCKDITEYTGDLDLRNHPHPLPKNLVKIYGSIDARCSKHPLPENLEYISFILDIMLHQHPLPKNLRKVGKSLFAHGYQYPLPDSLEEVGASLDLSFHPHPLPVSLVEVGGDLFHKNYAFEIPSTLRVKHFNRPEPEDKRLKRLAVEKTAPAATT